MPGVTEELSVALLELIGRPVEPLGHRVVSTVVVVDIVTIDVTLTVETLVLDPIGSKPEDEMGPGAVVKELEAVSPLPRDEEVVLTE